MGGGLPCPAATSCEPGEGGCILSQSAEVKDELLLVGWAVVAVLLCAGIVAGCKRKQPSKAAAAAGAITELTENPTAGAAWTPPLGEAPPPALPLDWRQRKDPASGRWYYIDSQGASHWELPIPEDSAPEPELEALPEPLPEPLPMPVRKQQPQQQPRRSTQALPLPEEGALQPADVMHDMSAIIGRGGGGIVHRGTLRLPDGSRLVVAIKRLQAGATESDERRFMREFRVALRASQRCPRACRLYGCVLHDQSMCLVMQLYPQSLHVFLDKRKSPDGSIYVSPLSHEEVVSFTVQILEGLAQLHAEGIVVQDLKPGNVLMDERNQLVLSDFGLAAILTTTLMSSQSSSTMAGGGTPAYKAPEQYDEDRFGKISPKTDMWALGCVITEMLTGFAPWRGQQPMQIMMSVAGKKQAPPIPSEAQGPLAKLLRNCFKHKQPARPTAEHALAALRS